MSQHPSDEPVCPVCRDHVSRAFEAAAGIIRAAAREDTAGVWKLIDTARDCPGWFLTVRAMADLAAYVFAEANITDPDSVMQQLVDDVAATVDELDAEDREGDRA